MKRLGLLLMTAFLLFGGIAKAEWHTRMHRMDDPVKVKIRYIDFYVFPNGDFDFNAHGHHYQYAGYMGVRIERDRYGKIRRVGNVYINYNSYGQVSRIGSIFVKYNRHGLVERIGRKRIRYHRGGYYIYNSYAGIRPGFVFGSSYYYGPAQANTYQNYNSYDGFENDYSNDDYTNDTYDDDNYYYRHSKDKTVKPKKYTKNRRK